MNYKLDYSNISNNHKNTIEIINIHKFQCYSRSVGDSDTKILVVCDVESMEGTVSWLRHNYKDKHSILLKGKESIEAYSIAFQETVESALKKKQEGIKNLPTAVVVRWIDDSPDLYSTIQSCMNKFFASEELVFQENDLVSRRLLQGVPRK